MFDNWTRRKKAHQLLVINQSPVRVAAPGWCENHLDGSLGDIDIEIGFDRMLDHCVPRGRIALPGFGSWLRCGRYFCGPYFISLSNCRPSTGVSIRPMEPPGISSARLGFMAWPSAKCDARPSPLAAASSRAWASDTASTMTPPPPTNESHHICVNLSAGPIN